MPDKIKILDKDFAEALNANDRRQRIQVGKIACVLAMLLSLAGVTLDYFLYPEKLCFFFELRVTGVAVSGLMLYLHTTTFGKKHYRFLGVPIALVPIFFLGWVITATPNPPTSPYYAGWMLIIMAASLVIRWNMKESLAAVGCVLVMYVVICFWKGTRAEMPMMFSNFFFLWATGIIVTVGNHFSSQLRIQEFTFRYQLDKSRKALEASLAQLKENEAQLVHSEKLASLGRMSAGMIHEINNPLNFTTTALFTLRKKGKYLPAEQQKDYAEILKDVEEGVGRVKTIVSDLRVFTRPDADNCDEVPVVEIVSAALRFLNIERKDEIQFEQELAPNLTIWANKNKLIHVFTNLLQNSLDALKTKAFTDKKPTIRIASHVENGTCFLSVRDNGPGIDAAHLNKIYDPFFTTKDVGAGMGLGLSICYRLVQEAQGKISMKTELGEFCEFTLEFPTHKKALPDTQNHGQPVRL